MKKGTRSIFLAVVVSGLLVFLAPAAMATGVGVYLSGGSGSGTWTADFENGSSSEFDKDSSHGGIGVVVDTAVARDKLFNYRLNLGYEEIDYEPGEGVEKYEMKGFVVDQDFGFGVVRIPMFRLWLGPEFRLGYFTGSPDRRPEFDIKLVEIGLGPAIGANFNIGEVFTISLKGGYLFTWQAGNGSGGLWQDTDYTVEGGHAFFNLGFIFRVADTY